MFLHARRKWEKAIKGILFGFVVIFIVSVFFWYGGSGPKGASVSPVLAKIGKSRIMTKDFEQAVHSQEGTGLFGAGSSLEEELFLREYVFDSLMTDKILYEAARKEGMTASRGEISAQIRREVDAAADQRIKQDKAAFVAEMNRAGLDLEGWKRQRAATFDRRAVAEDVMRIKLQAYVIGGVQATDQQVKESFDQYEAPYARVPIGEQGKEQARNTAQKILDELKSGQSFDQVRTEVAKQDPDVAVVASPGVSNRGSGALPQNVEKAALALNVGEFCAAPIEAQNAFYAVKLVKLDNKLPADFSQRKDFYTQQVQDRLRRAAWDNYVKQAHKSVKVVIPDKELDAFAKFEDGKTDEAIADLNDALKDESRDAETKARMYYFLGQLYEGKGDSEKAVENYDQAVDAAGGAPEAELRVGDILKQQGNKDAALARYKKAADDAGDSYMIHLRLEKVFKDLGEEQLAQTETTWLQHNAPTGGLPGGAPIQVF
jgi:peptidyl-prolyl cis-trans isomerase C